MSVSSFINVETFSGISKYEYTVLSSTLYKSLGITMYVGLISARFSKTSLIF